MSSMTANVVQYNMQVIIETFIPLKNCTDRSNEVASQGYELCSMCQGAYLLSENCFPSFINSVLCDKREIGCIFDFSDRPHGTCREEPLTLPVLRNHGSSECEDWIPYEIQV
uniref:Thyroglobulin type-1 domain-containing protein n=1 Tax=Angiostrongylus cantonensis TaxID=6313 RepID=A0A0K0CTX9_ANGCA